MGNIIVSNDNRLPSGIVSKTSVKLTYDEFIKKATNAITIDHIYFDIDGLTEALYESILAASVFADAEADGRIHFFRYTSLPFITMPVQSVEPARDIKDFKQRIEIMPDTLLPFGNVAIAGSAGSGKTFLITKLIRQLAKVNIVNYFSSSLSIRPSSIVNANAKIINCGTTSSLYQNLCKIETMLDLRLRIMKVDNIKDFSLLTHKEEFNSMYIAIDELDKFLADTNDKDVQQTIKLLNKLLEYGPKVYMPFILAFNSVPQNFSLDFIKSKIIVGLVNSFLSENVFNKQVEFLNMPFGTAVYQNSGLFLNNQEFICFDTAKVPI